MIEVDHFTPLSRAVASIDRDAYAARYAVYDQAHKALLRRLATADTPCSDADIAREEQAFRDAIRRIEFADTDAQPTLVPQDEPLADEPLANELARSEPLASEPLGEAPPEPQRDLVWPRPRLPRATLDVADLPSLDHFEAGSAAAPMLRLSEPRSLARRVGERMALAAMALALVGAGLWMDPGHRDQARDQTTDQSTDPASLRGAESTEAGGVGWCDRCKGAAADLAVAGNVLRSAADAIVSGFAARRRAAADAEAGTIETICSGACSAFEHFRQKDFPRSTRASIRLMAADFTFADW